MHKKGGTGKRWGFARNARETTKNERKRQACHEFFANKTLLT